MKAAYRLAGLAALGVLVAALGGCHRLAVQDAGLDTRGSQPEAASSYSDTGSIISATGCRLDYRLYRPVEPYSSGIVILAHGFMRGQGRMEGLARALAKAGLTTATINFCNARLWDGRHLQNGLDMVALARSLGARSVVYAGFSAGGLAALVAAHRDPSALGVLALDLVDDGGLGFRLAKDLDRPLIALMGDPSACNAEGNGIPVAAASRHGQVARFEGAGHCDFESPTDWFCELVCGRTATAPAMRRRIIATTVSEAAGLLGPGTRGH